MGGIRVRTELIPRRVSKLKHHAEVASEAKHPLVLPLLTPKNCHEIE